jgi:hypothetical protein
MNIIYILKIVGLISIYLTYGKLLHAQYKEVTIKDIKTDEGIPSVYVTAFKQSGKFETISNPEGKIKLPLNVDSIVLSHVAYDILHVDDKQSDEVSVIRLTPKITELASITIYNIDLRKKIETLIKNFSHLYVGNERTYYCTYKETFKVDKALVRLRQFNMRWWDKDYKTDLKKPFDYQNQVAIDAISYSRFIQGRTVNGGALSNKSFFAALHLNSYLTGLLWQAKDFIVTAIEKTNASTKISFDVSFGRDGSTKGDLKDSYFIFDNETGAIVELYTHLIYADGQLQHVVSKKDNIPLTVKYKTETRMMSFIPEKRKLRLSYFEFIGEHDDQLKDTIYSSENKLTLYITGVEKGNTISDASKIPLEDMSIHEQIENTPKKDPSILLTSEEEGFIKG